MDRKKKSHDGLPNLDKYKSISLNKDGMILYKSTEKISKSRNSIQNFNLKSNSIISQNLPIIKVNRSVSNLQTDVLQQNREEIAKL